MLGKGGKHEILIGPWAQKGFRITLLFLGNSVPSRTGRKILDAMGFGYPKQDRS